jgi:hypothetical protein
LRNRAGLGILLAGVGLVAGSAVIDTASAEPGRRLCVYGPGTGWGGTDYQETFVFLDIAKDDECWTVDPDKMAASFNIPTARLLEEQPVRKIHCEDLAADIAKESILGANFDPFPNTDACTVMTNDHIYSFKWDGASKRQVETDQIDKGDVSQWQWPDR